jgi:hypothetical protein
LGRVRADLPRQVELLAEDEHSPVGLTTDAPALTNEVPPMSAAPVAQQSYAFTLDCSELGGDFLQGHELNGFGFNDAQWCPRERRVRHHLR